MKKILLSLLLLCFSISPLFADLNQVRNLYTVKEDHLVAFDGKIYPKISFKDDLHEKLSYKLKDPEWADAIYNAYDNSFANALNPSEREQFNKAIFHACQLFGTKISRSEKALARALLDEGFPLDAWLHDHSSSWKQFFGALHPDQGIQSAKRHNGPLKVVVITTTTSGGNLSVAAALKAYLDRFPGVFETTVIDYETFASRHDPIMIASGKYTVDNIFRMMQQENIVDETLVAKDLMCQEAAKYIPNRTAQAMKAAIREIGPDLIISTRNYYSDDFNLLTLNIPFRMLNCDHDICFFHQELVGKVDPELVKFWLPSSSPRFFKTYFEMRGRGDLYRKEDDWEQLTEKIALVSHSKPLEVQEQFEVIGFPVRLEFQKTKDAATLEAFREKWDLEPGEKGVLVEMGANGVGILSEIFTALKHSPGHTFPIKYYFICGRNASLKEGLQKNLESPLCEDSPLRRCSILGFVEASDKNELMNICQLMIGKPGGSTLAEVSKLELPMFVMHIQKICELGNLEKLLEGCLAYQYDRNAPLVDQIEKTLKAVQGKEIHLNDPPWETLVLRKLLMLKSSLSKATLEVIDVKGVDHSACQKRDP